MAKALRPELDPDAFRVYLSRCTVKVQQLMSFLDATAQTEPDIVRRRYKPTTGSGITYYAAGRPFCYLHPKLRYADHVQVLLKQVDIEELKNAGVHPVETRKDKLLWTPVGTMEAARQLAPLIGVARERARAAEARNRSSLMTRAR